MNSALTVEQLRRVRLHAQGLAGERTATGSGPQGIADVARRMLAVQGQDWRSSRWALGRRAAGTSVDDVHRAFNDGLVVRSWPMRGTIHVVAAEDIGWLQAATNHRVLPGAVKRRAFLELSDEALARLVDVAVEALRGAGSIDRDELSAYWTEAGIEWRSNWRYHVIWWMCQNGITVLGPVRGGEPRLVLADEWIGDPRALSGNDALAELATRYIAARGAVQARDLAWWSGLTVREAKQGIALAAEAGRLEPVAVDASTAEHWAAPGAVEAALAARPADESPQWLLHPAFDEYLLGYTDRSAQLAPEHFERIVPGRNGMFLATVTRDGETVATWKKGARKTPEILITPLPGSAVDPASLAGEARAWAEFHGLPEPALSLA